MANELTRLIKIVVKLIEADAGQFPALAKKLTQIGEISATTGKTQAQAAREAAKAYQEMQKGLSLQEQAELKRLEGLAKVEAAQARAAQATTRANAEAEKAAAASKKRQTEEEAGIKKVADTAEKAAQKKKEAAEKTAQREADAAEKTSQREAKAREKAADAVDKARLKEAIAAEKAAQKEYEAWQKNLKNANLMVEVRKRLAEIEDVGVQQAIKNAKGRASATDAEVKSVQQLVAEEKKLKEIRDTAKDAGDRRKASDALKALRAETSEATKSTRSFWEELTLAGNQSRITGVAVGELGRLGIQKLGESLLAIPGLAYKAGASLVQAAKDTATWVTEQENLRKTTKAQADTLAGLTALVGDYKDVADAITQTNQQLEAAAAGGQSQVQIFKDLDVAYKNADGSARSFEQVLGDVDKQAKATGLSQKQLAALSSLLGEDSFKKLGPYVGRFDELREKARKFGLVLDGEAKQNALKFAEASKDLGLQLQGLALDFGSKLAPSLTTATKSLGQGIASVKEFIDNNPKLIEQIGNLAEIIGGTLGAALELIGPLFLTINNAAEGTYEVLFGLIKPIEGLADAALRLSKGDFAGAFKVLNNTLEESGKIIEDGLLRVFGEKMPQATSKSEKALTELAKIKGITREEAIKLAAASGQSAESLLEQAKAAQTTTDSLTKLDAKIHATAEAQKQLQEAHGAELDAVKSGTDAQIEAAEDVLKAKLEAAQAIKALVDEQAAAEIKAAQDVINAQRERYAEGTKERQDAENQFLKTYTEIQNKQLEVQKEVNAAAAAIRAKAYEDLSKKLEDTEKDNVAKLEVALETGNEKYEDAARKRLQYTRDRINGELTELKKQQQAENVGAEEKIRLAEQVAAKERELRDANRGEEREVLEGKLKDIDTLATKENSELNLKKAKNAEFLEVRKKQGFDEIQLLELKIKLGKEELEQEIRNTRAQIDRLEAIKPGSAEVNDLTAHLNDLLKDQITFARESGEQLQAAYNKAAEAAEKAGDKAKEAADKVGDAAKRQLDGLAALYSTYANRVSDAAKLTEDQVEAGIKSLQDDLKGLSGVVPPEIAGLVGYFQSQTSKALQEAYKRRDEFDRQRREKEQEDARKAAEDAAKKADDIAKAEIEATKRAQETRRKALKDARQQEEKETKDHSDKLYEIGQDLLDGLAKARDEHAAKEEEKRKRRADEEVKAAQELAQRLAEAENSSEQNRLDKEEDFIKEGGKLRRGRADLEKQLADERARIAQEVTRLEQEAAAAEASGDRKKAEDLRKQIGQVKSGSKEKDIQGKLDENSKEGETLAKQQEIQTRKNEEIQKALKAGYDKEKLDAVLKSIDARFGAEEKYLADLLDAQKEGDELEQKQLKENYEKKQKALEEALKIEFDRIEADRAAKQKAREEEDAQDEKDYEDKKAELNKRAEDARNEENARHQKELDDLKKHREEIRKEYQKSLDEIAAQTKQKLADAGLSVDALTAAYNRLNAAASKAQGAIAGAPGSGSQPSTPGSSSTSGPAGTTAPTTAGDGGNSRVTPPANTSPPAPSPSPTTIGVNSSSNQGSKKDKKKDKKDSPQPAPPGTWDAIQQAFEKDLEGVLAAKSPEKVKEFIERLDQLIQQYSAGGPGHDPEQDKKYVEVVKGVKAKAVQALESMSKAVDGPNTTAPGSQTGESKVSSGNAASTSVGPQKIEAPPADIPVVPKSTPAAPKASAPVVKGGSYGLSLRPGDYGRASEGLPRPIAPPVQKPPAADQLGGGNRGGNVYLSFPDGLSAERIRQLEQYAKGLNAQEQRARDAEVERMTRGLNG